MSVALSIAFTGLCALVSDGDDRPAQILLLDAGGVGEVAGMTFPAHAPTLAVSLSALANPDSSSPTRVIAAPPSPGSGGTGADQVGLWDLSGTEVRIRVQGGEASGVRLFQPSEGETSWPNPPRDFNDAASWRDVRFVADMGAITGDGRIDPSALGDGDGVPTLPSSLAARVHLDAGLLEGSMPSQEKYRDAVFEFRSPGSGPALSQALTDTVLWTLHTEAAAIVIEIVPVAGGTARRLLFASHASTHRVFISNLPVENGPHASAHAEMTEDELSALHFAAFYKLLLKPVERMALPLPRRASESRKGTSGIRPSHCPMVRLTRG